MKKHKSVRVYLSQLLIIMLLLPVFASFAAYNVNSEMERLPWLHTNGTRIVDSEGNIVILRGANYMGDEFGKWDTHTEGDYAKMASWGFNVVRLPIAWSYIEPQPGVYSDSYFANYVDRDIGWAKKYGIYVILDMHQYNWAPKFGGDGAPDWACSQWSTAAAAEEGFWNNVTLQSYFVNMWNYVASRYANESTVCGYDLFNEPGMQHAVSDATLYNFYNGTIKSIRSVDSRHIIFYEPPYSFGSPQKINQPNLVLSTHLYTYGITGNYDGNIARLERHLLQGYNTATNWGIPFWVGEFAIDSRVKKAGDWCRDYLELMDKYMIGSAWWSYWRDDSSGSFYLLDSQGKEKPVFINILDRPYPMSTSADIGSFSFNVTTKSFRMVVFTLENSSIRIHVSERHYPFGFTVSCNKTQWNYSWDQDNQILAIRINSTGFGNVSIDPTVEGLQNEIQQLTQDLALAEEQVSFLLGTIILLAIALIISNLYWYLKGRRILHK